MTLIDCLHIINDNFLIKQWTWLHICDVAELLWQTQPKFCVAFLSWKQEKKTSLKPTFQKNTDEDGQCLQFGFGQRVQRMCMV